MHVSTSTQAYLDVALQIAPFPEYGVCMREHLLETKLRHWEPALRELASKALAALVGLDPAYFTNHALPYLVDHSTDRMLEVTFPHRYFDGILCDPFHHPPFLHCRVDTSEHSAYLFHENWSLG